MMRGNARQPAASPAAAADADRLAAFAFASAMAQTQGDTEVTTEEGKAGNSKVSGSTIPMSCDRYPTVPETCPVLRSPWSWSSCPACCGVAAKWQERSSVVATALDQGEYLRTCGEQRRETQRGLMSIREKEKCWVPRLQFEPHQKPADSGSTNALPSSICFLSLFFASTHEGV